MSARSERVSVAQYCRVWRSLLQQQAVCERDLRVWCSRSRTDQWPVAVSALCAVDGHFVGANDVTSMWSGFCALLCRVRERITLLPDQCRHLVAVDDTTGASETVRQCCNTIEDVRRSCFDQALALETQEKELQMYIDLLSRSLLSSHASSVATGTGADSASTLRPRASSGRCASRHNDAISRRPGGIKRSAVKHTSCASNSGAVSASRDSGEEACTVRPAGAVVGEHPSATSSAVAADDRVSGKLLSDVQSAGADSVSRDTDSAASSDCVALLSLLTLSLQPSDRPDLTNHSYGDGAGDDCGDGDDGYDDDRGDGDDGYDDDCGCDGDDGYDDDCGCGGGDGYDGDGGGDNGCGAAGVDGNVEEGRVCVANYYRYLSDHGITGGWDEHEHAAFMTLYRRHKRRHTGAGDDSDFCSAAVQCLPGRQPSDVWRHLEWYVRLCWLDSQRRRALAVWSRRRSLRQQQQQRQLEEEEERCRGTTTAAAAGGSGSSNNNSSVCPLISSQRVCQQIRMWRERLTGRARDNCRSAPLSLSGSAAAAASAGAAAAAADSGRPVAAANSDQFRLLQRRLRQRQTDAFASHRRRRSLRESCPALPQPAPVPAPDGGGSTSRVLCVRRGALQRHVLRLSATRHCQLQRPLPAVRATVSVARSVARVRRDTISSSQRRHHQLQPQQLQPTAAGSCWQQLPRRRVPEWRRSLTTGAL